MWSFFSRDPTKDFNYDVGEKVPGLEDRSLWTLRQGKKKDTGDPVSIFTFDIESGKEAQTQLARTAFKRIKTLRHPNILTFLDGLETDRIIYFVTELVSPLSTYHGDNESDRNRNELSISWGLHQICKGLSFLVNDCGFVHNNVCMASVFVDQAGEWKLGGIEYLYQAKDTSAIPPLKFLPALEIYNPPEKEDYAKRSTKEKWAGDMWGLGCLIWEVFNGNLRKSSSLKAPGKISQSLLPHYCQLVGANPKSRPNPAKFLENCRQRNGFMDNTFVNTMLYLEEIQIKDQNEKNEFFNSLTPALDSFPVQFCRHKILPQLVHAFEYGNAGSSVLAPLFKVGKLLDTEEYQKKIVPCVIKLFSSPDRATRVKLLQQIDIFVEHLQTATVNEQIFPHVTQGLMDTNPLVRESTIKAMLHLAPKLNYKNLNEELMKHFARLQTKDEQGGIRTNTTVCLGKIANYLCPQIRQKIISSAFLRALKDPFPPARQAGILAMAATQNYYFVKDIGMRLLPALSAMTVDPDKCVRDQTFKAIKGFLSKLETVSENPDLLSEIENEAKTGRSNSSSSWAGWAVTGMSSLTSRLYSKTSQNTENETGQSVKQQAPHQSPSQQRISFMKSDQLLKATETKLESEDGWEDADGWGEIEDVRDGSAIGISDSQKTTFSSTDEWDDENWGSLEASKTDSKDLDTGSWEQDEFTSTQDCGLQTTSNYNWNTGSSCKTENNFSSFLEDSLANIDSKSPGSGAIEKPHAASRTLASPSPWEGTFEWEGDNWSHPDESGISNVKTTRRPTKEREERRLQREKELQEKRDARKRGIMKLGTKKIIK